jgi:hypothetical protein
MEDQQPIPDHIKVYTDHEACRYMLYGAYPPHISAAISNGDDYAGERYAAAIEQAVHGPDMCPLPGGELIAFWYRRISPDEIQELVKDG